MIKILWDQSVSIYFHIKKNLPNRFTIGRVMRNDRSYEQTKNNTNELRTSLFWKSVKNIATSILIPKSNMETNIVFICILVKF